MTNKENQNFTALDEYLRKVGNIFFRWRSYIPLLLIPLLILKLHDLQRTFTNSYIEIVYQALCLVISFTGELVRILTIGFVPSGTSGRNTKAQRATMLNTTGIYSITRNPLYLGNYLMILGISLFSRSWEIVFINSILFFIFYVPIILTEENFLLGKFGNVYSEYVSKAPCFSPRFNLWTSAENNWNWGMVIRREYSSIFSLALSFVFVAHMRLYVINKEMKFSMSWLVFGSVFLSMWVIVRILRLLKKL
jgi:protein-S-isoprenylcysteine O-methyltransferase Ste14